MLTEHWLFHKSAFKIARMAPNVSSENLLPELLSTEDLAAYLGVPVSTIHYWRWKEQGPPALKIGRELRFRASDVARWLEARGEAPAA
jgi:excisionase family DNA binding protein